MKSTQEETLHLENGQKYHSRQGAQYLHVNGSSSPSMTAMVSYKGPG